MDANIGENWELRLFGHPELRCDDGRLIDLPTKAFAIAARLLLDRPEPAMLALRTGGVPVVGSRLGPSADEFAHLAKAHS